MENHLRQVGAEGKITFTGLHTGLFLDWAIKAGALVNARGPTRVFNGGAIDRLVLPLDSIGRAVAEVVNRSDETENRFLYIHDAVVTQNQLL